MRSYWAVVGWFDNKLCQRGLSVRSHFRYAPTYADMFYDRGVFGERSNETNAHNFVRVSFEFPQLEFPQSIEHQQHQIRSNEMPPPFIQNSTQAHSHRLTAAAAAAAAPA